MSIHKIKYTEANTIATLISEKAFEHLQNPIDEKIKAVAEKVIAMAFEEIGETNLHRWDLIEQSTYCRAIINCSNGNWESASAKYDTPRTSLKRIELNDDTLYDELAALKKEERTLANKRDELRKELMAQIEGKSVKTVIAAWPEAERFIRSVFKKDTVENMTRPLDALLAKYLPALPAPEPETIEFACVEK